jgi:class 3 adenylate cyclase
MLPIFVVRSISSDLRMDYTVVG